MRKIVLIALAGALAACARSENAATFKGLEAESLATGKPVQLASCPAAKCLTVYVAPWCGYCRQSTPMINELAKWLEPRGVHTRVVVGMDRPEAVRDYAREFGKLALLDPEGKARPQGGVPNFRISTGDGTVTHSQSGAPAGAEPPFSDADLAQIAGLYRLP